jgi:DNA-binding NarL/FixJ family response regulator
MTMPDGLASSMAKLTGRQREVLILLATSMSNREIAHRLEISERTVKAHVNQILERLELNTRIEAAVAAVLYHRYICFGWWRSDRSDRQRRHPTTATGGMTQ